MGLVRVWLPLCLCLAACTNGPKPDDTGSDDDTTDETPDTDAPDTDDPVDTDVADTDDSDPADTDAADTDDSDPVDTDVADTDDSDPADTDVADTDPVDTDDTDIVIVDMDGDGFAAAIDCDDDNEDVNPDADERCNDLDDDCDEDVDEDDSVDAGTWYLDLDGDDAGDATEPTTACEAPEGYVATADDCDDDNEDVNPDADERCNDLDDDCDEDIDEDDAIDALTWYVDLDGDDAGDATEPTTACEAPEGYVASADDCDDDNEDVSPSAIEACNGVDDDCDEDIDEDDAIDALTWYADLDGDAAGDPLATTTACEAPEGYVASADDCDDDNEDVNPSAIEACNGVDDDCDEDIDEDDAIDALTWYADVDGDLSGDASQPTTACDAPDGYVASDDDCDDDDETRFPDAPETCNDVDDDCDEDVDEDAVDAESWYIDDDGDGFFGGFVGRSCDPIPDASTEGDDCDDTSSTQYPGAPELCDGVANDCDTRATWDVLQEDGRVTRYDTNGLATDVTAGFAGDVDPDPGTYVLCPATYDVHLLVEGVTVKLRPRTGTTREVVLTGSAAHQVLTVAADADVTLTDLTLTSGTGTSGGLIEVYGALQVNGGTLRDGAAVDGGCVYAKGAASHPTFDGVTVTGCAASGFGGALWSDSPQLDIQDSTFSENKALAGGALFLADGSPTVNATLTKNTATAAGGAVVVAGGTLTIDGKVSDNRAPNGGGIYVEAYTPTTLKGSALIASNTATSGGGGVCLTSPPGETVALGSLYIAENSAGSGGGVYVQNTGTTKLSGTTLADNTAGTGGGYLGVLGVHELTDVTTARNTATGEGVGGVALVEATGFLERGSISENTAFPGAVGGLLLQDFEGYLSGTSVTSNGSTGEGGGVALYESTFTLSNAYLANNYSESDGGGLHVASNSKAILAGAYITFNSAVRGAGVYVDPTSKVTSAGDAISFNRTPTADSGAGVYLEALEDAAATFSTLACDFEEPGTFDNAAWTGQDGQDIYAAGTTYSYGNGVSVVCDAITGCL